MNREHRYVIGIPTVARPRGYLVETVNSIVSAMSANDFKRARIVIFNGDESADRSQEIREVWTNYACLRESGALVIASRREPVVLEPSCEQAVWQRKQTLDCAALLEQCQDSGGYYLHLEDDVIASPGFLDVIDARLNFHRTAGLRWAILSFYNSFPVSDGAHYSEFRLTRQYFGLIGQVFQIDDLASLCRYLQTHYTDAPVDSLVARWALSVGRAVIGHAPSLFQHVGVLSSFQGRIQLWDSPQFPEDKSVRWARLRIALRDVAANHPGVAKRFLSYRRKLRKVQRLAVLSRC